jgi:ATP-binding cassette subfamily C protein
MTNSKSKMVLQGQLYRVKGNEPILLDDPQRIWVVQCGSMALFAVTVKDGAIEGTRRYLCSINQGEALFGTAATSEHQNRRILAVPIGETELLHLNQECFSKLVASADTRAIAWVEGWLGQLGTALSHVATPAIQVRAAGQTRFSLSNGQTLQPESDVVCWLQLQQGSVRFLGFEELTLTTTAGIFPLSDKMWLEAVEEVQLATNTTAQIRNSDTILAGLSQLHIQLLYCCYLAEQAGSGGRTPAVARSPTPQSSSHSRSSRGVSIDAEYQDGDFFLEGTPLLVAAGAVGRAMGVKIRPPARSENLKRVKEPLSAIVRASRIRMRRVLLRDNWWEKDCGPLVAYTQEDNRPIALLPVSATRYEIFDPVERTRLPVDARRAETLAPVAYMFYRSLPDKALKAVELLQFALKNRGKDLVVIVLTGIAVTLLGMLTPYATAILIDNAIPDSDRGLLLQVGLGLLVAAIATALFQLAQGFAICGWKWLGTLPLKLLCGIGC